MFEIKIKKTAFKDLNNLDDKTFARIDEAILSLKENPYPLHSSKLSGKSNQYRIKIGAYRILYSIHKPAKTITIYRVKHRQSAYKHLWRF